MCPTSERHKKAKDIFFSKIIKNISLGFVSITSHPQHVFINGRYKYHHSPRMNRQVGKSCCAHPSVSPPLRSPLHHYKKSRFWFWFSATFHAVIAFTLTPWGYQDIAYVCFRVGIKTSRSVQIPFFLTLCSGYLLF